MYISGYLLLACEQWNTCSLSSHALPPPNHAHAQCMKYKHPNSSNHGHRTYIFNIYSHNSKVSGLSAGAY